MNCLEAKVVAVNRANAAANELYKKLVDVFRDFVGEKVETAQGNLLVKVERLLPAVLANAANVYRHRSNYSLAWTVKACENADNSAVYYETTVYIGKLSGGVLTELAEPCDYRTDFTASEILAKRNVVKEAEKVLSAAKSALYPFGEYDR